MSLNSFSSSINSDFSSSNSFELIEIGLGSGGSVPRSTSFNPSSTTTFVSFSVVILSSFSILLSSFEFS